MNKDEIFKYLDSLDLDKDKYLIISGASLVIHGLLEKTGDIDLACSTELFNELDWEEKIGLFDKTIKYKDVFEIGPNFYWLDDIDIIDGYQFMGLKNCLKLKIKENKEKDKDVIKKLQEIVGKEI